MLEMYDRFSFCFVPLCKTGGGTRYYKCGSCGASYPA